MRPPPVAEAVAALLASALTWTAWPWWHVQADAWMPSLPAALGLLAAYAAFRLLLSPARALLAWTLAAGIRRRGRLTE